jgi:hypothetical protein
MNGEVDFRSFVAALMGMRPFAMVIEPSGIDDAEHHAIFQLDHGNFGFIGMFAALLRRDLDLISRGEISFDVAIDVLHENNIFGRQRPLPVIFAGVVTLRGNCDGENYERQSNMGNVADRHNSQPSVA